MRPRAREVFHNVRTEPLVTDTPPPPEDAAAPQDAAPVEETTAEGAPVAETAEQAVEQPTEETAANPLAPPPAEAVSPQTTFDALPAYARSLLKVKVPVVVTLAARTESIDNITNMGPGTILQFDKSCEEPLELEAGGQPLALGEAVKVGDKFGLRILSMRLPHERFQSIGKPRDKGPGKKAG